MSEAIIKILAELIVIFALNWVPFRQLKAIHRTLKGVRRDLRRVSARLDRHERRLDRHDAHAGINTKDD